MSAIGSPQRPSRLRRWRPSPPALKNERSRTLEAVGMLKANQLPLAGVPSSTTSGRAQVKSCFRPMRLRGIKRIILQLLFVGCSFVSLSLAQTLPNHPNVVIILADDLGYGDVSFNGCPDYLTPNIDSLTTNGVGCSSGHVTHPFCSLSRAALITGRYQHRFGHENQPQRDASKVDTIARLPGLPDWLRST